MQPRKRERLLRPLLIGSVLLFVNVYWIVIAEAMFFRIHSTVISLFFGSVYTLFLVLVINQLIKNKKLSASYLEIKKH